jgi:hypothetical protein
LRPVQATLVGATLAIFLYSPAQSAADNCRWSEALQRLVCTSGGGSTTGGGSGTSGKDMASRTLDPNGGKSSDASKEKLQRALDDRLEKVEEDIKSMKSEDKKSPHQR